MVISAQSGWRSLSEQERAIAYSPSSCLGGPIEDEIRAYVEQSKKASAECADLGSASTQFSYGQSPNQTIDVFSPATSEGPVPLVIYFHGGYWQELSKEHSLFAAADCLRHNIAFAAVGYTLAPDATLDQIVRGCRLATASLRDNAVSLGVDVNRIVVAGSSAGAHLAAMVSLGVGNSWRPAAAGLISGIFDLEPLIGTYVNDALKLTVESAHRNSPLLYDLSSFPPALIAYGQNETDEFKRQSSEMATALRVEGTAVRLEQIPGRNHFDVILDLCNSDTELGRAMLNLVQSTQTD